MGGYETFDEIVQHYHERGVVIYLFETNAKVHHKLSQVGILKWVAEKKIFNSIEEIEFILKR